MALKLLPHEPVPELGARNYAQSMPAVTAVAATTNAAATDGTTNKPPISHNLPLLVYRLTNTPTPLTNLMVSESAVLLRNALIDTSLGWDLGIPPHLKSEGDPESYIVQARGPVAKPFHDAVKGAGAQMISYIPNNAFLVRATEGVVNTLRASPMVAAVLPWEPYYKLDLPLLEKAVKQEPLPPYETLTVLLFPGERDAGIQALRDLGAKLAGEDRSPFGHAVTIQPQPDTLAAIARLTKVQSVELYRGRQLANDLTRVRVGVSANTIVPTNYLNLSGTNVIMGIVDTGVEDTHPDLVGRVFGVTNDFSGHGTHVAGIMASSGENGPTNAPGSLPGANYRGMAPASTLFSLPIDLITGPFISDAYLQEAQASTNVLISNNSWGYPIPTYNLAAASYDASVRDALPEQTGPRPLIFVFAAGNTDNNSVNGGGGVADQVFSPATSKNGIAVGSLESPRFITNEVVIAGETNRLFFDETDSFDQVAFFSSRGNVGIGLEGDFGRFKPDLVAPGSWTVSARSSDWVNPTSGVSGIAFRFIDEFISARGTNFYPLFMPVNSTELTVRILPNTRSPQNMPALNIHANQGSPPAINATTFEGTNFVTIPVTPGDWWVAINNTNLIGVHYDIQVVIWRTNDFGTYFEELKKLNDALLPNYRYESGTSMAAPAVSGVLGLMQEFYEQKLGVTNSPAMMKALLINGARSLNCSQCPQPYDLQVRKTLNHQGWGLVSLTNSIPRALQNKAEQAQWPIIMIDQDPNRGLATGDSHTYEVSLTARGRFDPLRVTLVWTDPPGNPASSLKLVNDLDLIVTNLSDTAGNQRVYIGNNIGPGADFNQIFFSNDTNTPPPYDVVNNVENVFINSTQPLSARYSVTVRARRVNVNAVTTQTNGVMQDYALVISSGNSVATNVFSNTVITNIGSTNFTVVSDRSPFIRNLTNKVALFNQRVGANTPLFDVDTNNLPGPHNGVINQWNFYIFEVTNSLHTNVAIFTFLPPELSIPRNKEADIDLYVSFDPSITNLNNAVIRAAPPLTYRSLTRGGTEIIVFTNAPTDRPYYVAVKSEDQQAANFSIAAFAQQNPFGERGEDGSYRLDLDAQLPGGIITDGTPASPGGVTFIGIGPPDNPTIRRLVITNTFFHELGGDLVGTLTKLPDPEFVVLNNHDATLSGFQSRVYDDSDEADLDWAEPTDGPGSLRDFTGKDAFGIWFYTMVDNARSHTGFVANVFGRIEPQEDTNGLAGTEFSINPNQWRYFAVDVPIGVTNFIASLSQMQPPNPLDLYLRRIDRPTFTEYDKKATIPGAGGSLALGRYDLPPLQAPGRYWIGVYNSNSVPMRARLSWEFQYSLAPLEMATYYASNSMSLIDDAKIHSIIAVTNAKPIADVKVGVRIDHPRVSDLVLHLVSPQGTRIVLAENRGGILATNYGGGTQTVFTATADFTGDASEFRTNLVVMERSGILRISYDFINLPDSLRVYYDDRRIYDSGVVRGAATVNIPFGPGLDTNLVIVVNEGGNLNTATRWNFNATVTGPWKYAMFTDRPTLGDPLKFAFPPFFREPTNFIVFSNSFEVLAGEYITNTPPQLIGPDGPWVVQSNWVAVQMNTNVAQQGSNYLALSHGAITVPLTNIFADREYMLGFAQRKTSSSPTQTVVIAVTNRSDIFSAVLTNPPALAALNPPVAVPKLRACPGQQVLILVSNGVINFGSGGLWGAQGNTNTFAPNGFHPYGLMGCWSTHPTRLDWHTAAGRPFYVGTNTSFAAPTDPGDYYLFLGVNEDGSDMDDNDGYWQVDVRWQHCQLASGQFELGTTPVHFWGSAKTNWQSETLSFVGNPTITNLTIRPDLNTTLLLDNFVIREIVPAAIYQSEEPMVPLQAEYAAGEWKLEVWDNRTGPINVPGFTGTNANGTLLSWSLNIIFADGPGVIPLTNDVAVDHFVRFDEIRYFQVAVPREVTFARNVLLGQGVELLYSSSGLPVGSSPPDPIDPSLLPNPLILDTNAPPGSGLDLPLGQIYYLGVRNTNPGNPSNNFRIRTDFSIRPAPLPTRPQGQPIRIVPNTSSFLTRQSYQATAISNVHYYYFDVPTTNEISSYVHLEPVDEKNSNLNLILRRALPVVDLFPHETFFDYQSTYPDAADDKIIVSSNSIPVKLTPGRWYVGVYNNGLSNNHYRVWGVVSNAPVYRYTDIVIPNGSDGVVIPLTNTTPVSLDTYYRFVSDQTNAAVLFQIYGLSSDADVVVKRQDIPSHDLYEFSFLSTGPKPDVFPPNTGSEPLALRTNIFLPNINPTNFFIKILDRVGARNSPNGYLCVRVFTNVNPIIGCEFNAYIGKPVQPGGPVNIIWDAVVGTPYYVESTIDLINWTAIPGYDPIIATTTPMVVTLPAPPGPMEFYRIRAGP